MDPNIMKFLEEDEDETMHSGADVEAFTAELNRDIEGNNSTQEQPSDSNAALSQGNSQTTSQFLPQWHNPGHDGIATFQSGQDIVDMGEKDQHSSELELQRQGSDPQNRKEDDSSSHEPKPLLPNPSIIAGSQLHDDRNTFPLPQPVGGQASGEQPTSGQVLEHDAKPDKELQMNNLQNISHHPSMPVGSNDQQPLSMEFSDQQILPTGKGNQQTSMGISNDQVMPPLNHHTTGMAMTSQQAMTSGMSTMTSTSQLKLNKQVCFGMLLPIIQPQLDNDRAMQLHTLYFKRKKNEISKDGFVRHMRSIVGDQMLKMAVYKLQKTRLSQLSTRMASLIALGGPGNSSKASPKKPLIGQKKPMEAPGSSPPSSKKQKVSGSFIDQSIEHLNDVTAVSGVNLREEEEQLFSGSKEDSRVSEASQRVVQEEEERLILQKIPLQKKMVEIMAKSGLKNMSKDVQRCLSLCVEERMRGLISNVIRLSKQRVDIEKPRHKTIITSDVRQQIMAINRKAREEWEKKQAETEKSQKVNEPESGNGTDADKDKDDGRGKSTKVNKEEDDKMCTTAANVAVRAATGVGDIISRWQLMIEAKQKQGGSDTSSAPQTTNKDVGRKPPLTTSTRENQESEKQDSSVALTTPAASVRKVGRNQVVVPRVARCISVKDVISVLEREPQMSKSTLLYRLY